jgi:nucleotide-binding universal stress UspA family protein
MIVLKHVLVATDFSEAADAALAYGRELARTFGATLHVLHVADDVYVRLGGDAYTAVLPELQRDVEATARKRLNQLLIDNDPQPLPIKPVVITASATPKAIVDYARSERIDLVVVGTHGRGGVAHLLMGSVAERVVRTAPCPVLTVRHPEHDFVMPDLPVAAARARQTSADV